MAKLKNTPRPLPKPPTTTISLRLPEQLLSDLRCEANRRDVHYQHLMKIWLAEKVAEVRK